MDKRIGRRYKFDRDAKGANKRLDDLFDCFCLAKKAEGRSVRTLEMYAVNYKYFCEYMDSIGIERTFTAITPQIIRTYMNWMLHEKRKWEGHAHKGEHEKTVGLSPATVNTKIKTLKTMFRFLNEEGYVPTNPFSNIKKVSEPIKQIQILSVLEMRKLLSALDKRSYAGFRDLVLITVLIDSSARIGEILSLKKSDIDFRRGLLFFSETVVKTRRARNVPVTKRTLRLLKELIAENDDFNTDHIFLTNYGLPISNDQFRRRLNKHALNAGLELRIHPYLFRHTSATLFLENGGDLHHLAKTMGHVDIRMSSRYVHLSEKSVRDQHDKYSPINDVVGKLGKDRKTRRTT